VSDIFLALVGAIGAPAFVFLVFAVAFGLNPAKAAAWGAIVGMAAIVAIAVMAMYPSAPRVAWSPPDSPMHAPQPAKDNFFDDPPTPQAPGPPEGNWRSSQPNNQVSGPAQGGLY
jgi:hypothetical protein